MGSWTPLNFQHLSPKWVWHKEQSRMWLLSVWWTRDFLHHRVPKCVTPKPPSYSLLFSCAQFFQCKVRKVVRGVGPPQENHDSNVVPDRTLVKIKDLRNAGSYSGHLIAVWPKPNSITNLRFLSWTRCDWVMCGVSLLFYFTMRHALAEPADRIQPHSRAWDSSEEIQRPMLQILSS